MKGAFGFLKNEGKIGEKKNVDSVINSALMSVNGHKFTRRKGLAVANDADQIRAELSKYDSALGNVVNRYAFVDANGEIMTQPTPQIDKNGRLRFRKIVTQVDDDALNEIVRSENEENKHFQGLVDKCVNDTALKILLGNIPMDDVKALCKEGSFTSGALKDYKDLIHSKSDEQNCMPSLIAPMPEASVDKQYALQKLMMILKIFDPDVAVNTGTKESIAHFDEQVVNYRAVKGDKGKEDKKE
jgi:hypothetical protein